MRPQQRNAYCAHDRRSALYNADRRWDVIETCGDESQGYYIFDMRNVNTGGLKKKRIREER